MHTKNICVLIHISKKGEVGAVKSVYALQLNIFTDPSKAVFLSWIIHVIFVLCLLCFPAGLFIDALWSPAGKELMSLPWFVMSNYEFVTFPLVYWVRCST